MCVIHRVKCELCDVKQTDIIIMIKQVRWCVLVGRDWIGTGGIKRTATLPFLSLSRKCCSNESRPIKNRLLWLIIELSRKLLIGVVVQWGFRWIVSR
jgi:hypothetical protein